MKNIQNREDQFSKLEHAMVLANDASNSENIVERLGAFVLYAGIVDFFVIQAARLVEQIFLKGQIAEGKDITFLPHNDSYFYDHKVSTRSILKGINKMLPFQAFEPTEVNEANRITGLAKNMTAKGLEFVNFRDPIVHQIGNSKYNFDDLINLCNKANITYHEFRECHKEFLEAAAPYR